MLADESIPSTFAGTSAERFRQARIATFGRWHGAAHTLDNGRKERKSGEEPPENAKTDGAPAGQNTAIKPRHRRLGPTALRFEMRSQSVNRNKTGSTQQDSERHQ